MEKCHVMIIIIKKIYYYIYNCLKVKSSFREKLFQKEKNKLLLRISARQLSGYLWFNGRRKSPVAGLNRNPCLLKKSLMKKSSSFVKCQEYSRCIGQAICISQEILCSQQTKILQHITIFQQITSQKLFRILN